DYLNSGYELEYLEKEFIRQKELFASKAVSDKSFEQAQSAYKMKRTDHLAMGEKLKLIGINPIQLSENNISSTIKIYSPISGFVSQVKVNIGKYIQASEVLFDLVNPEDIHLNMTVFEKDLPFIAIGQKVKAYNNSKPSDIYPCEIILIGQDVSTDRHVEVHCHFEKYNKSLIPGMYMNAEIETQTRQVYVIPESSIVSFQGATYMFYKEGEFNFRMVKVKTGLSESHAVEIIDAEQWAGKQIVTEGAYELLMMLKNVEEES
ncbi:MAG: efflux RND transporter periplasmic adaptor subunit, partial [Bacteroidetes bacterium]|nr:efflux RND transporter periplasmic adaptor subunit [Bacteroidota bacterium]